MWLTINLICIHANICKSQHSNIIWNAYICVKGQYKEAALNQGEQIYQLLTVKIL